LLVGRNRGGCASQDTAPGAPPRVNE
jgi:hypothetical protein